MPPTPFFGPFDVTRSPNFADNQCINLRPEVTQLKDGRNIGVLYGTPGLDLLTEVGNGPINGSQALGSLLYVVSGLQVYTVTAGWVGTLVDSVAGNGGQVSMVSGNENQIAIFTNTGLWVGPIGYQLTGGTISSSGYPLTGGTIGAGGINYAIGDIITLHANDGTTVSQALLQVLSTGPGGAVTSFGVFFAGTYSVRPTGFTQASDSGVGSGFTLTAPTYGGLITGGVNYAVGDTIVLLPNDGTASAAAIIEVTTVSGSSITGYKIVQGGSFQTQPTGFVQKNTTGAGSGFILTSPTYSGAQHLCSVDLPFVPDGSQTISGTFQDGFALCNQPGTNVIWQSLVDDISVWPALNFANAVAESDLIVAMYQIHRLIYVFKQIGTEVWSDAGAAGFAFQPIPSVMIEHGVVAWGAVSQVSERLIFLAKTSAGNGVVYEIEGFNPKQISTHAIEYILQQASTLADAFSYSYQQEGHHLYVLTLPSANVTLVYDQTESNRTGAPIWYQWLSFLEGMFARHWGNSHSFFNATHVLGDYRNGNLYRINLDTLTDAGTPRKWMRSWRALQRAIFQPMRFASLQIDMQTGVNVPDGTNPQVELEWSDDGGNNWSSQVFSSAGQPGQTAIRVKFNRLGATKRGGGLERIFRLSSSDTMPVALLGAELDV